MAAKTTLSAFEAVDDERRAGVAERIEAAHRVEIHRERHEAEGEPSQRVGGEQRGSVSEQAVLDQADDDLARDSTT